MKKIDLVQRHLENFRKFVEKTDFEGDSELALKQAQGTYLTGYMEALHDIINLIK